MARLLSWPIGLRIRGWQRMTGPRAVGGGSTESVTGFVQTASSAFGGWRWQLSLVPMKGRLFRLYSGMVDGLHGGANAVRVPFADPDGLSWQEAGVTITEAHKRDGVAWSNRKPWSNGKNWTPSYPSVPVSAAAAQGDTIVALADQHWGHKFAGGERIGFFPFHFGMYRVTQVIAPGQYRLSLPLRKALATTDYATLRPVLAMRLENEAAGTVARGAGLADNNSMILVEVQDADVRRGFAD